MLLIVVPLVLLVAALFWYDATAVTIRGVVLSKEETVKLYTKVPMVDDPYTDRSFLLHMSYTPPNSPTIISGVTAPEARFDRTHVGDEISLRYLKQWPRITIGLADRSAFDRLRDAHSIFAGRAGTWYLWEIAGVAVVIFCVAIGGWGMFAITCAFLACSIPLFFIDRGMRPVPAVAATAVVGATERFDKTPKWGTDVSVLDDRNLTQPYESVELTYVPGAGRDSVRAVDAIDVGSAGALVTGARVAIRYDATTSREAQLVQGTRTFRSRNRFDFWPETLALGVMGLLGILVRKKVRPKPKRLA